MDQLTERLSLACGCRGLLGNFLRLGVWVSFVAASSFDFPLFEFPSSLVSNGP